MGEHPKNQHVFRCDIKKSKISKIIPFIKWRRFVIQRLEKENYDSLVILTTIPGVLLNKYLIKKYKENYIFDIRDYTFENLKVYSNIVNALIKKSKVTLISSEGFKEWLLPSEKIYLTHNISNIDQVNSKEQINLKMNKLSIGFVGGIRYYKENCQLIDQLKEHPNLTVKYIGKIHLGINLKEYCRKKKVKNVVFEPEYKNDEKKEIYEKIDIINAVYGSETFVVKTALPNKLYDCILFKKPIMVSKNTYLEKIVEKYKLGFAVDIYKDNIYSELEKYVKKFNSKLYLKGCNQWLEKVLEEESYTNRILEDWANKIQEK
ncbi:MAG: hypothetical protein RR056_03740 [Acetivibrio sp.]